MPSFNDLKNSVPNAWRFSRSWLVELINEIQASTIDVSTEQTLENKSFDAVGFLHQGVTPANPDLGFTKMYIKSDGNPYILSSAGVERGMLFPSVVTINSIGTFNDVNFSNASLIRCTNSGNLVFTGLLAGTPGQIVTIVSAGSGDVFFVHENASSAAANRLVNTVSSGNTPLANGKGYATYQYDGTSQRWKLINHRQGKPIATTPTWTAVSVNPAIGNGTLTGTYVLDGNVLKMTVILTAGSTTTFGTGLWRFNFPYSIVAPLVPHITAVAFDTSAAISRLAMGVVIGATTFALNADNTGQFSATVPFAWATGDTLNLYGEYNIV